MVLSKKSKFSQKDMGKVSKKIFVDKRKIIGYI